MTRAMKTGASIKPADWESREVNHIRIVTRLGSRRSLGFLRGDTGESHTLCGAPLTKWDLTMRDARTDPSWIKCAICRKAAGG